MQNELCMIFINFHWSVVIHAIYDFKYLLCFLNYFLVCSKLHLNFSLHFRCTVGTESVYQSIFVRQCQEAQNLVFFADDITRNQFAANPMLVIYKWFHFPESIWIDPRCFKSVPARPSESVLIIFRVSPISFELHWPIVIMSCPLGR